MSGAPDSERPAAPDSAAAPVRVVVVDDHALVREGTVDILERDPMLSVVGQAADGEQAVELICQLRPDLAIVDVELPGMNGIEVVRAVHARADGIRFLIVSAYDDHAFLIEALAAGPTSWAAASGWERRSTGERSST